MEVKRLKTLAHEIGEIAKSFGLDFFPTIFEVLDYEMINQVAAYGGYPTRFPHWRFGMEYEYLSKSYEYGLSRIYEMVINNNPCYAYLLASNTEVDQKMVMAHVYGHSDFFKNNFWFSKTNRKMIDEMANHGTRIRTYIERFGINEVEGFIDHCLSIENLIDPHMPFIKRGSAEGLDRDNDMMDLDSRIKKIKTKDYMENFVNPEEYIDQQKKNILAADKKRDIFPKEQRASMPTLLAFQDALHDASKPLPAILPKQFLVAGNTAVSCTCFRTADRNLP